MPKESVMERTHRSHACESLKAGRELCILEASCKFAGMYQTLSHGSSKLALASCSQYSASLTQTSSISAKVAVLRRLATPNCANLLILLKGTMLAVPTLAGRIRLAS
ncbi:hypothetical protein Tco_0429343 [Tanacetum coccineum]